MDLPKLYTILQALLLLQEHGKAYQALCDALERGEGVGGCVVAIEAAIDETFGRNGELPAQTRARKLEGSSAPPATKDGDGVSADGWRPVQQVDGGDGAGAQVLAGAQPATAPATVPATAPATAPATTSPRPEAPGPAEPDDIADPVGDFLEERRYQVARRLDAIKRQLAREDATRTEEEEGL